MEEDLPVGGLVCIKIGVVNNLVVGVVADNEDFRLAVKVEVSKTDMAVLRTAVWWCDSLCHRDGVQVGIGATDTNIFYMTSDNQLKYTASDRTLKSCRAYFRFSDATPKARTFTLNFGDGSEATGIISTKSSPDSTNDGWYTVDGMKLGKQPKRKGVYIQNGRKVVIK